MQDAAGDQVLKSLSNRPWERERGRVTAATTTWCCCCLQEPHLEMVQMKLLPLRDIFPPAQQVGVVFRHRCALHVIISAVSHAQPPLHALRKARGVFACGSCVLLPLPLLPHMQSMQSEDGCVEVQELADVQRAQPDAFCAQGGAGSSKHGSSKQSTAPSGKPSWLGRIFGCHPRLAAA